MSFLISFPLSCNIF